MTDEEKIQQIKAILRRLDTDTQREILWQLLTTSLAGDLKGIRWILTELKLFLDDEGNELIGEFQ
jgi:hypothetical protein